MSALHCLVIFSPAVRLHSLNDLSNSHICHLLNGECTACDWRRPSHALNTKHSSQHISARCIVFFSETKRPSVNWSSTEYYSGNVSKKVTKLPCVFQFQHYTTHHKLLWLVTPLWLKHYVSFHLCSQVHKASKHQEKKHFTLKTTLQLAWCLQCTHVPIPCKPCS